MSSHKYEVALYSAEVLGVGLTLTSGSVDLRWVSKITGLSLRAASVLGTANVRVEMQLSRDDSNWDEEDDRGDITSSTLLDRAGNPEGWNVYDVPAPGNNFARFLIDEISAGGETDTLIDARLICEESLR